MNKDKTVRTRLTEGVVVDVAKGVLLPGRWDIYVQDGRILELREAGREPLGADRTIALNGNYVIPGIINTHCHTRVITPAILSDRAALTATKKYMEAQITFNMKQCIEHGVTTLRDALSDNLGKIDALKKTIAAGDIPGPRIVTSVLISHKNGACIQPASFFGKLLLRLLGIPILDYTDSRTGVVLLGEKPSELEMRNAVDVAMERGGDFIKLYAQREKMLTYKPGAEVLSNNEVQTLAAYCSTVNRRILMHHLNAVDFALGYSTGVKSLAHLPIDRKLTNDEIEQFRTSDTMIESTLSLAYYYCWNHAENREHKSRLDRLSRYRTGNYRALIDKYWVPELRQSVYKNFERAEAGNFTMMGGISMLNFFKYMDAYISTGFTTLVDMLRHGCGNKICFGNDAGATQCSPATKDVEIDMLKMCCIESGMSTKEMHALILNVFTRNGAIALGKEHELGAIRKGYRADIAVYTDNPLKNSDVLKNKTALTVADGRIYIHGQLCLK